MRTAIPLRSRSSDSVSVPFYLLSLTPLKTPRNPHVPSSHPNDAVLSQSASYAVCGSVTGRVDRVMYF